MSKSYKNKRNNDIKVSIYIIERNESKNDSKRMILKQIGSFIVNLVTALLYGKCERKEINHINHIL